MSHSLKWSLAIALACLVPQASYAQVKLKYKINPGKKTVTEVVTNTKQTLTLAGMNIETAGTQKMEIVSETGQRADDGTIRAKQSIKRLEASMKLPGGIELEFDSANADAPPAGTQFDVFLEILKATSKSTWTTVYGKNDRIIAIEGREEALKDLDEATRQMVSKQFDPEYLKEQGNVELDRLPSESVSKGDKWERTTTARLEAGQNLEFKSEYEYMGTVEKDGKTLDKIGLKVTGVDYSIDDDAPTPLRASDSNLKVASSEGHLLFDRQKGSVVESDSKVNIKGSITFSVNGMELPGQLDLTMQQSSKVQ